MDSAPDAVCGLVVNDGLLYALGYKGKLFVVDIAAQAVVNTALFPHLMRNWGSLSVINGEIYGITSSVFFRLDKSTLEPVVLVDEMAADWYGVPRIAVDDSHQVYAIKGRNLIKISGLDTVELEATVSTRCVAGKVLLQVTVLNQENVPVDVVVATEFGTKSFSAVQPGKSAFHAFSTRSKSITAGAVRVDSVRLSETALSGTISVSYNLNECR